MRKALFVAGVAALSALTAATTATFVSGRTANTEIIEKEVVRNPALGSHFTAYQSDKYPDLTYAAEMPCEP